MELSRLVGISLITVSFWTSLFGMYAIGKTFVKWDTYSTDAVVRKAKIAIGWGAGATVCFIAGLVLVF